MTERTERHPKAGQQAERPAALHRELTAGAAGSVTW